MRTLITGGSGLLALNWAYRFRDQHDICLVTHHHSVSMQGVESISLDLGDSDKVLRLFDEFCPDVVVHAAGLTNVDECERDLELAMLINAELAGNMARLASLRGIKFVHMSTDQMFKGDKPFVTELDALEPTNNYGLSKCKAEELVLKHATDALLVRTNFYGWGHKNRTSITDWVIEEISSGRTIKAFSDVFFTPIFVDDLVSAIYELLEKQEKGVFNIVSDERISKYHFALAVANVFGLQKNYIIKASISDVKLLATRPYDMSLSNNRITQLFGKSLGDVENGLKSMLLASGRRTSLNASLEN